jgi:hypothetical protein
MRTGSVMALGVLVALVTTSCSTASGDQRASGAEQTAPASEDPQATTDPNRTGDGSGLDEASDPTQSPIQSKDANSPSDRRKRQAMSLQPLEFPHETTVRVKAELTPACASRGETVNIIVKAPPTASIAYQAVYSDNQGGADAPYGQGYGGNNHGEANPEGTFESSWIIKPHAPIGRGRVDVVVGYEGEWGYAGPRFAVADGNGRCPERWLEGDSDAP